jgi:hypothetical protein
MFLILRIKNIIPPKLINPLNLWTGDSPERMEMCCTLLGTNDKQLLNFFYGQAYKIYYMHIFEALIVAITCTFFYGLYFF